MKRGNIFFPIVLAVLSAAALLSCPKYFLMWYQAENLLDKVPVAFAAIILLALGILLAITTYLAFNSDNNGNPIKRNQPSESIKK